MDLDTRPLHAGLWEEIFANGRPVSVEIGPGKGEFLFSTARANRQCNFFAIERSRARARAIQHRVETERVTNARVVYGDAACIIDLLPDSCVAAYYIHFPDPWWKRRHHRRRLWSEPFVTALRRTLIHAGTIELITDVADTFALAQHYLNADRGLQAMTSGRAATPSTSFARKAIMRGAPIYLSLHRKSGLSSES